MSKKSQDKTQTIHSYQSHYAEKDSFPYRLKSIIDGTPYSTIATQTGLSDKSIRDYVNGKTTPNLEKVKLLAKLKNCSAAWLAFGIGPKETNNSAPGAFMACEPALVNGSYAARFPLSDETDDKIVILTDEVINEKINAFNLQFGVLDVKSHLTSGLSTDNLNGQKVTSNESLSLTMPFQSSFLKSTFGLEPEKLSVYQIISDSMSPSINPMDIALIQHDEITPVEGLYLIYINGVATLQHVQQMIGNKLNLTCSNPRFADQQVDKNHSPEGFRILGKLLWVGKTL